MPKSKKQHLRYKIIDRELRNNAFVKTARLVTVIQEYLMENVDIRTIQTDINNMRDNTLLGYNAPIKYDKSKKSYYYSNRSYSITHFSLVDSEITALKFYASCLQLYSSSGIFKDFSNAIDKIISGISIKQKLKKETNPDLIIQTDTVSDTAGNEHLELIVHAIDEKSNISFPYKKFNDSTTDEERQVSPYLLKEYKNRWYVLGMDNKDKKIKTFGLDRMSKPSLCPGTYLKHQAFDPGKYFKHSFGITTPAKKIQLVKLQFNKEQIPYVKSLPIHSTQIIISESTEYIRISIEIIPSYELYEYILGKMPDIRVISPAFIANKIKKTLKESLERIK